MDEMANMEPQTALKLGVTEIMEILLEMAGVYTSNIRGKHAGAFSRAEKERIVKKVMSFAEKIMLEAMRTTNGYGVNRGRFIAHIYIECANWLDMCELRPGSNGTEHELGTKIED